jgi:NADH-quinone oxidoreductase subunit F
MKITSAKDLDELKKQGRASLHPDKPKVLVGSSTCGIANGASEVMLDLAYKAQEKGIDLAVTDSGCYGFCQMEPLVDIWIPGEPRVIYKKITTEKTDELLKAIAEGRDIDEWALLRLEGEYLVIGDEKIKYKIGSTNGKYDNVPLMEDVDFFKGQLRIATRNCGYIKPTALEEYVGRGGLYAVHKALTEMKPEGVIDTVLKSGLRGRGGGGFSTGRKWTFARGAEGDVKYIICNADEGDPGAYMDRSVLEGDPYSVLEGMIIGAYAVGNVADGYIYVRNEYPRARDFLTEAIETLREHGVLGKDIMGTGFDFDIHIAQGAGAFVCGEETALIHSIEGRRGMPRPRPPYPAVEGLFGKPTVINNVESWSNIPVIIDRGAEWFSSIGSEGSKGTKVFSLVGNVNNTGLVEVPMGVPLWDIVFGMGGGIPRLRGFKGVQTGGPSGGCLSGENLNLPVDFDRLTEVGSMMGSGGMIVMDEHTCIVDMAKYFLTFTKDESCGKCTPCREGIPRLLEILDRITAGEGTMEDLDLLEELGKFIKENSLCGLGQTAPNPLLSTLNHYRDEYEAHVKYKKCPGAVCDAIISAPCHHICPVGMEAPSYIAFIAEGKFDKALEVIYEASPFAGVCGRVCHHPCEFKCTSGDSGDPISIRALKRFASEKGRNGYRPPKSSGKNGKVAVIGAGPAGLSCAWDLALLGYQVTVFEALPVAGGMLYAGIPEYRLPRDVLNREIDMVRKAGVEIKTGTAIGRDVSFEDLQKEYKAVFVATGAHKGLKLGIDGEDSEGVKDAVDFLREFNIDGKADIGKKAGVIGGGNAAIDAARTALRAGADEVTILYRRTKTEMPADELEIEAAIEEGIKIEFLVAPTKVIAENGHIKALECVRMELGDVDASGRRRPVPKKGTEFIVELDTLFPAISQEPDVSFLPKSNGFNISKWNTIEADPETLATNVPGVFAGGDVVTGPYTVTDAMGQGKKAARSIHKYLQGEDMTPVYEVTKPAYKIPAVTLTPEEAEKIVSRPAIPYVAVTDRIKSTNEVELTLDATAAVNEAKRCLRCDWHLETGG